MPILSHLVQYATQHATRSNSLKSLLALTLLIVFKYRSHAVGTRPRRDLKQPPAVPLLGHMPLMASIPGTRLYDFFEKYNNELGPIWSISLPIIGRMIQCDLPEHVEHVLKTNFWSYEKGDGLKDALGDLFGQGYVNKRWFSDQLFAMLPRLEEDTYVATKPVMLESLPRMDPSGGSSAS